MERLGTVVLWLILFPIETVEQVGCFTQSVDLGIRTSSKICAQFVFWSNYLFISAEVGYIVIGIIASF